MKGFYIVLIASALSGCNGGDTGKTAEAGKEKEKTHAGQEHSANNNSQVELTEAQWNSTEIVTGRMEQRTIATVLKLNGVIDVPPQNKVSVSVPLGGYLKSTNLLPGTHVSRGERIAVMEDPQYIQLQQDYLTAKAKLTYLEQEYNRQRDLNASKASSDKVTQQAQMDFTSQKILVKSLSEKLELIGIRSDRLDESNLSRSVSVVSPIDGFVTKVNVNIGKYVNPADVLFEIVDPRDIHLALTAFEKDMRMLAVGQQLVAYTNNEPGIKYPCEIILIGKDFGPDRSVEVHCHFKKYDRSLIPGMFMNAEVSVEGRQTPALPADALVSYGGKQYVFVVTGPRRFAMREVKIGRTEKGYTAIDTLQAPGTDTALFVTKGAYTLLMKMKNTGDDE